MYFAKKIILFLLLAIGIFLKSFSQTYNFKHYSVENGFPQANANHIIQDRHGYLWIGTQVGAVRFDGKNYFILDEEKGIASHITRKILEDHKGNLWFGTYEGLSMYNNDTVLSFTQKDGLPHNLIHYLWERNDTLWIMTEGGLCYRNNKNEFIGNDLPDGISRIYCVTEHKNNLFIGTNQGIILQNGNLFSRSKYAKLENFEILDIICNEDNSMWLATASNGLIKCMGNGEITQFNESNGFVSNYLSCLLRTSDSTLWIGSEGKGVIKYDGENFVQISKENGMKNTSVLHLMEDTEGNIWIGGRNGLTMYNPLDPFTHYTQANKTSGESVFGMLEDSQGNIWFTTYGNGLSKLKDNTFTYYDEKNGLADNRLFSILEDKMGNIWLSTAARGIVKFDGKKFTTFDATNGFANTRVFKVFMDEEGNIWSCTSSLGAVKYDGNTFTSYTAKDGLPGNIVMSGLQDSKGNLWFGHFGSGIGKFENNSFIDYGNSYKIPAKHIRSISEDKFEDIWFGTATHGVFRVEQIVNDSAICYYINKKNGLNSNNIYFTLADKSGNLWAGTEKGIDKITFDEERKVKKIHNYTQKEGFIGGETSINGAMEDKDGNLWFGSVIGATKYSSNKEKQSAQPPQTHITALKLFYEEQNWEKFSDSLNYFGLPNEIILKHKQNHLTFEFIGINFSNPEKVKYQFKLENLDENWSPFTNSTQAVYTNIPPGEYTFKVRACNNDGIWNKKPTQFNFSIAPPFWQTPLFYLISAVLLASLVIFIIRLRERNLKRSKQRLETIVSERTNEIISQKQQIEEQNEELNQINEELNAQKSEILAQRDMVETQKRSMENIHKQVTDSILYAEKIQKAVFPSEKYLQSVFNNYFIFHKPLHIVSGDFYWALKKHEHLLIALADCTGHGVPGGFMSMLGMAMLNDIVNKPDISHPNIALDTLRENIISSLNQGIQSNSQKDGMDIALCAINQENNMLEYAGANISLYIGTSNSTFDCLKNINSNDYQIHENNTDKILIELKPDKMPISIYEKMNPFKRISIQLHKGDKIYMLSDGYTHQFGGKNNRKFSKKKLHELILSIQDKSLEIQHHKIKEAFLNWKNGYKQVDDILILGLEV